MKFKPGDPVWINCSLEGCVNDLQGKGELAGVVIELAHPKWQSAIIPSEPVYIVDASLSRMLVAAESVLRPRRDDYQQHEGLGSREQLNQIIHQSEPVLV